MDGSRRSGACRVAIAAVLAAALALAGCAPDHDWREVRVDDGGYRVMLPARPARMTRTIELDGLRVEMTMSGAQARGVAYTVATATLPDDSDATRERALATMRVAMVRNIGGAERASRTVSVPVLDGGGAPAGNATGTEVEATGRMRDGDAVLLARFVGQGARVWQAVVLGPAPDREQAATFLDSLKLQR